MLMAVIFMLLYSFVKYLLHVILRRVETKRTVAKAKAIQSSEATASRQPRDEQSFEAVKTATSKSLHKYYGFYILITSSYFA